MIQILLSAVGALAGIASMVSLYFWLGYASEIVTGNGLISFMREVSPQALDNASSTQIALIYMREYFVAIGGAIGWLAFFVLFSMTSRPWNHLPRLVIAGCFVGVVAAVVLAMSAPTALGVVFAGPPVLAVGALLLRAYMAEPGAEGERILL